MGLAIQSLRADVVAELINLGYGTQPLVLVSVCGLGRRQLAPSPLLFV